MTNPNSTRSPFVHGLDEIWWISKCHLLRPLSTRANQTLVDTEPYRKDGHSVDESKWDEVLRQSGFSGSELVFRDHDQSTSHEASVVVSYVSEQVTNEASNQKPPRCPALEPRRTKSENCSRAVRLPAGIFGKQCGLLDD